MTWTRRRTLQVIGLSTGSTLAGCQDVSLPMEPERHLVELRNYVDRSVLFVIRVAGGDGESLWEYGAEIDGRTTVDELFTGTPAELEIAVDDREERAMPWERIECGGRERASTTKIGFGADTEMDSIGVDFRCEALDAKFPE